jgi:Na+-translocating ferredoxin:NAD+ oxidoreductase RNF subunit RnfB
MPVAEWQLHSIVQECTGSCNLSCVNDCAERGVALIQQSNETTKDEAQTQNLLQVVEKHRKDFKQYKIDELEKI